MILGLGLADIFFGRVGWACTIGRGGAIGALGVFVGKGAVTCIPAAGCTFVFLFGFGNLGAGLLVSELRVAGGGTPGLFGLFDVFTV